MEQFKIRPDGFKDIRRQILIRSITIVVIAVPAGLGISFFNPNHQESDVNVWPILIPMVLLMAVGASAAGIVRGLNRAKQLLESYCLTVTETAIMREQKNTPTISLRYNDIKEIIKNKNGSFKIKGPTAIDMILVPAQIDNYQHLESTLNQIRPIKQTTKSASQKLSLPLSLLTIGLFAVVYVVSNKIIVGICGTALSGILIYSIIQIHRSKNIDNRTRRIRYWLLLPLVSIVVITILKLTAK